MMLEDIPLLRPVAAGLTAAFGAALTGLALLAFDGLYLDPVSFLDILLGIALPIALAHAAIVAAPIYFLLAPRHRLQWWSAALGGFVTGIGPMAVLTLVGPVAIPDLRGMGELLIAAGVSGMVGGLAFRAVRGPHRGNRDARGGA